ncbi:MAG: TAXI family TRAP transporter solute-binding subunit, partial [Selenomonadaceae bacterium]|nr:TAXI family TRAP transporter solute-binding subunit [Selenomonadaceae bacterium]
ALENGEIDAFFCTAGAPTSAISDLATRQEIRLIPIDLGILANMQKMYKGYTICTIPANTYPGQKEDIPALGVKAILVANAAMPEKDVTRITEILFRHAEELQASAKLPTRTDISYATQDIPCAFHAGAAKYYEAQGISVNVYSGAPGRRLTAAQD